MTRGSGRTALVAVLGIVGVLALLVGAGLALVFGPHSHLQSKATRVAGPGSAILGEGIEVDASSLPIPSWLGELTLDVKPVGNDALFVGTGSQADVDNYLRNSPYDVVTSLQAGSKAQIRSVPGSDLPQPPDTQTFWLAKAAGAPGATVSIASARGSESTLVVMNRLPSNGVRADIVLTLSVGWSWITALVLLGVGVVALLIAIFLAVRGRGGKGGGDGQVSGPARHGAAPAGVSSTVLPGVGPSGSTGAAAGPRTPPGAGSPAVANGTGAAPALAGPDTPQRSATPD